MWKPRYLSITHFTEKAPDDFHRTRSIVVYATQCQTDVSYSKNILHI